MHGVTRERLRAFAEEPPGWDVLHVAGHGEHGAMLLEKPCTPDPVSIEDLVTLLRLARRRLKFAVLRTCHSGAPTTGHTLHWFTLPDHADDLPERHPPARTLPTTPGPWLPTRYTSLRVCPSSVGGAGTCGTRISASRISIRRPTSACHRSSGRVSALRRLNG